MEVHEIMWKFVVNAGKLFEALVHFMVVLLSPRPKSPKITSEESGEFPSLSPTSGIIME